MSYGSGYRGLLSHGYCEEAGGGVIVSSDYRVRDMGFRFGFGFGFGFG